MGQLDLRIAGKYKLQRRIGGGGFAAVYIGTSIESGEEVAIKLEHVDIDPSQLKDEFSTYQSLSGGPGIPKIHSLEHEGEYRAMVLELLGPSLADLFSFCSRKFSLKTVLMLADQLIDRLSYIHSKGVIHRDIKPENFLMGAGKLGNQVYVTDLGLSVELKNFPIYRVNDAAPAVTSLEEADMFKREPSLIGTAYYASIRGHLGVVQYFCDDLEALGYILIHFVSGSLPWKDLKAADEKEEAKMILEWKKKISTQDLCEGLPPEFASYFDHIRALRRNAKPDYSSLRKSFRDLSIREGFEYDHVYDWTILKYLIANQSKTVPIEEDRNTIDESMSS
ncbi:MAG: hypothetical protein Q9169_007205 [Polycauliona sp. 2 TL-2023]